MKEEHFEARKQFAKKMLKLCDDDDEYLERIVWTDETYVSEETARQYLPHFLSENAESRPCVHKSQGPTKYMIFVAMAKNFVFYKIYDPEFKDVTPHDENFRATFGDEEIDQIFNPDEPDKDDDVAAVDDDDDVAAVDDVEEPVEGAADAVVEEETATTVNN